MKPTESNLEIPKRRLFLQHSIATVVGGSLLAGSTCLFDPKSEDPMFTEPGMFADRLLTLPQVEGPFYPDKLPLDTDNDLLIINEHIDPSVGQITHLTGTVSDQKGNLIRGAVVEIWQCDSNGIYHHKEGGDQTKRDTNFQSFGRFTTNLKGEYYFRTIKPVPYPGRTPHIHVMVYAGGKKRLTTQMYIKGHPMNAADQVKLMGLNADQRKALESLNVEFKPLEGSKLKELTAHFDIVIGVTPEDDDHAVPSKNAKRSSAKRKG